MSEVDWSDAPEDAEFFAYGYFRKTLLGSAGSKVWDIGKWLGGCVWGVEHFLDAPDYEKRPSKDDPVYTPEATPDVTTEGRPKKPDGAVKYKDYKWWNSEGLAWCPDHEFWYPVFVAQGQSSLDKDKEIVQRVNNAQLNKAINQAELLHKKYKTSVDFLNIVKDIQVERGAEYEQEEGERSFEKIATVFNVYRGKDLLPSDIALILEIMKNVRFYAQDRYHLDSVIDKVSYGSLWAELVTQERA